MEPGLTASRFRTTSWTLIVRAPGSREDLERLLGNYWSPVYAYLRRKGRTPDDAADLTQGFLVHVLEKELVARADQAKGRFRAFLLRALQNYVIDQWRRGDSDIVRFVPPDDDLLRAAEPSAADDPARAFDRQWATEVMDQAIATVERACDSDGMTRQWTAFEARVLGPAKHGCGAEPMDSLLARLGEAQPQVIYSMIQTIKRKISGAARDVVAETIEDQRDLDSELAHLLAVLAG